MLRPLSLFIGLRYSRARRRNGMVSFISVISTLGIALGVAVLIMGLSAMNGFQRELNDRILAVVPHGEITPAEGSLLNWQKVETRLQRHPGIVATAPYVTFTALADQGTQLKAVQIRGVDPASEEKISALPQFVLGDAWKTFRSGKNELILGKGVADSLGLKVGDWLTLMIPNPDPEMKLRQPKRIRLQITGLLQLHGQLDHTFGMVPLRDAQEYLDLGEGVSGVAMKVDKVFEAAKIVRDAGRLTGVYGYVRSWMGTYGYMYRDIQMVRVIMYLAMVLVISVACFNIVSTLVMAVKDKQSDIAVLRTMGANNRIIRNIFLWYGMMAGMVGCAFGVVGGVVLSLNLTRIIRAIETLVGHKFLSGDIYFVDFLPSELRIQDVVLVALTAIVLSLLASLYPAWRATKIDPARILSGQ
ncbi:MAG: lipoprotein-releasing ABC transporter permease subunit LolE [Plesiomonas sp.]|uniref:lipoprotein-releasing ABC transporter permease subunit LolE n=1 Tax=Plesiomonas sp. TaxID=2486279 RepID=UPI003F41817A